MAPAAPGQAETRERAATLVALEPQEEAPGKGEYGSLVIGFRRFGEDVSQLGRLAALYGRRSDQPAGCELVNVPRQHSEFFGKIALLPRIEHAEHFGDRFAIV